MTLLKGNKSLSRLKDGHYQKESNESFLFCNFNIENFKGYLKIDWNISIVSLQ